MRTDDPGPHLDVRTTKDLIDGLCRMALLIPVADAQALLREFDRMDAVMPIVDPTGYRALLRTMPAHRRVAEAFLTFRQVLEREVAAEPTE